MVSYQTEEFHFYVAFTVKESVFRTVFAFNFDIYLLALIDISMIFVNLHINGLSSN